MNPSLTITPALSPCPCRPAVIWAEGITAGEARVPPPDYLGNLVARVQASQQAPFSEQVQKQVRAMLRHGRYHPSGRAKPASEFLLGAAKQGELGSINIPVDVNNAVSLESGLPASVFDVAKSGTELLLRRGLPGESYIFNRSGQAIDLTDLLLVCCRERGDSGAPWVPCGNPVKDSMATKTDEHTTAVVAVLFSPVEMPTAEVTRWAQRFAGLLAEQGRAAASGYAVIDPQ